jgi:hypothetical protein
MKLLFFKAWHHAMDSSKIQGREGTVKKEAKTMDAVLTPLAS